MLGRLKDVNLRLNSSKCMFGAFDVFSLGHLVDVARIKPHQSKVVAIQGFLNFATPTNVKASHGLIG